MNFETSRTVKIETIKSIMKILGSLCSKAMDYSL
jgi:hypothetical protein